MFGSKKKSDVAKVPVFNIPTVNHRKFEPIEMIHVTAKHLMPTGHEELVDQIAQRGAELGADCVVNLTFHSMGGGAGQPLHAFGTAIRYID